MCQQQGMELMVFKSNRQVQELAQFMKDLFLGTKYDWIVNKGHDRHFYVNHHSSGYFNEYITFNKVVCMYNYVICTLINFVENYALL